MSTHHRFYTLSITAEVGCLHWIIKKQKRNRKEKMSATSQFQENKPDTTSADLQNEEQASLNTSRPNRPQEFTIPQTIGPNAGPAAKTSQRHAERITSPQGH